MTKEQLREYVECGHEIEFKYKGKEYSITYWYPDENDDNCWISFCEFYKETTEVKTADELWDNVSRDGTTVGNMLSSVSDDAIYIY